MRSPHYKSIASGEQCYQNLRLVSAPFIYLDLSSCTPLLCVIRLPFQVNRMLKKLAIGPIVVIYTHAKIHPYRTCSESRNATEASPGRLVGNRISVSSSSYQHHYHIRTKTPTAPTSAKTNPPCEPLATPIARVPLVVWVSTPRVLPFQQYLAKQLSHTPLLVSPALSRARSTTAHARHAGHSGSVGAPASAGKPCVAMIKVWSSIAWICEVS